MRLLLCLFLTVFASGLRAQAPEPCPCAPWEDNEEWFAMLVSAPSIGALVLGPGPWLKHACYSNIIPPGSEHAPDPVYCTVAAPWGELTPEKLGSRINTILFRSDGVQRTASEKKAAFIGAWKRHVTLPMLDPSLSAMREAIRADEARRLAEMLAAQAARAASAP